MAAAHARRCLCKYFSCNRPELAEEVATALAAALAVSDGVAAPGGAFSQQQQQAAAGPTHQGSSGERVRMLLVPHGAACDGFMVAASAYTALATSLRSRGCRDLTVVLLGTDHWCTPGIPIATSIKPWTTPLGPVDVDTAAAAWLASHHNIPVDEGVHAREHSIENQLPFLQVLAAHSWDTAAAVEAGSRGANDRADAGSTAGVHIVPISVGRLESAEQVESVAAAVSALLHHLRQGGLQNQQGAAVPAEREVVVVATSDYTHAGPFYGELPQPGESLEGYMERQDRPVLQAVASGMPERLLEAAASVNSSMCGLHPLAVALRVAQLQGWSPPRLLRYTPAHLLFPRPDSTGFAAHAVYG